jgi:hypothetical protein
MSYRHTKEAVRDNLHDLETLFKGFPDEGNIPAIEMDLALQKLRNLYELMLMMRDNEQTSNIPRSAPSVVPKATRVEVPEKQKEVTDHVIVEKAIPVQKPQKEMEGKPDLVSKKNGPEVRTLAEQFQGKVTLHESLHQIIGPGVEPIALAKPVNDLYTAIGINDRFTFIRELFNNDKNAFESTIHTLNEADSFNDAYNFMIRNYDWNMDSEAVQLLLDIIRRKYIKGRHE